MASEGSWVPLGQCCCAGAMGKRHFSKRTWENSKGANPQAASTVAALRLALPFEHPIFSKDLP